MSAGRQRFSIIPAAAVTDRRLEPRDLQVLCLLGRHTDDMGWCCRSQVKMARELGCGRATVQRAIARLVDAAYIEHRSKQRESGADAAHDYRVVFDAPEVAATQPTPREGVPIYGQGCPPMSGQGVPTHERAPMLTTLVKRTERGAREETDFEKAYRTWPTSPTDSREDAWKAWEGLAPEDRQVAADEATRCISFFKSIGRKHVCSFATYLRDRRWLGLPPRPVPVERKPRPDEQARKPTKFEQAMAAGAVDQAEVNRLKAELIRRHAPEGAAR